ncbi:MAG TPA: MdtA/MuxA family multidrug efflux RND transporter periplasmic adaptor subunit [Stellaceae bacterium]|nr:MdtA/MuxA family multidrug efflux RND transporter periplasmic adaptor subunit [Stellaceae bacterium]
MDDQPTAPFAPPLPERGYPGEVGRVAPQPDGEAPSLYEPRPGGRRSVLWLLLLLLVVAGLATWLVVRHGHEGGRTRRFTTTGPMPVGTAKVTLGDMPVELSALGTVTPLATVTVQTQINGQLIEVGFKEGQMVRKGDFLAQIDPRPYQVALEQAQAQLAKDRAALNDAQVDLARYRTLVAQNSIARQTLDTQVATVQQDIATIKADQAQIDTQKLNLVYCHIVAPVGGRVGLRQVDPGNYVQTTSTTGIVVITQLQPISVIFTLPEDSLPEVLRRLHAGATLTAVAYDRTGATKLDTGTLETVDNQIDPTTGTVKLRAVFNNPDMILFPNQFVNVKLLVNTLHKADLVPVAAIQRGEPGTFVYVVKPNQTVAAQPVALGPGNAQEMVVTKGVQPGELVVTDGADRLKDGAKVRIAEATTVAGGVAPVAKQPAGNQPHRRRSQPAGG